MTKSTKGFIVVEVVIIKVKNVARKEEWRPTLGKNGCSESEFGW
jgi:hypothetical protein